MVTGQTGVKQSTRTRHEEAAAAAEAARKSERSPGENKAGQVEAHQKGRRWSQPGLQVKGQACSQGARCGSGGPGLLASQACPARRHPPHRSQWPPTHPSRRHGRTGPTKTELLPARVSKLESLPWIASSNEGNPVPQGAK